ncbi:hypothetical protein H9P43_003408 [Blastocladiella emersonii ATCC 22665]|nr:hypothetical protein H9P43_003408 [Blastocladiella emersonii ATCC 22665]
MATLVPAPQGRGPIERNTTLSDADARSTAGGASELLPIVAHERPSGSSGTIESDPAAAVAAARARASAAVGGDAQPATNLDDSKGSRAESGMAGDKRMSHSSSGVVKSSLKTSPSAYGHDRHLKVFDEHGKQVPLHGELKKSPSAASGHGHVPDEDPHAHTHGAGGRRGTAFSHRSAVSIGPRRVPWNITSLVVAFHIVLMGCASLWYTIGAGYLPMTSKNSVYPLGPIMFSLNCIMMAAASPVSGAIWVRTLLDLDTNLLSIREAWLPSIVYGQIVFLYLAVGLAQVWPKYTIMMPLWSGGIWFAPAVAIGAYLSLPAEVKAAPDFKKRFMIAIAVPSITNFFWFALCGFYVAVTLRHEFYYQIMALVALHFATVAFKTVRSKLVNMAVSKMNMRQRMRLASLAAFEIEAAAETYLGMCTPEVNWIVWLALSIFQNVMLTSKLVNISSWIKTRVDTLKAAGTAESEASHEVDEILIDHSINEYILDVISKLNRSVFFTVTMTGLYYSPNKHWFPFTPAYADYFLDGHKAVFTIAPEDLSMALVLSWLSMVPVLLNALWANYYVRSRLGRNMTFYLIKMSWVPILSNFVSHSLAKDKNWLRSQASLHVESGNLANGGGGGTKGSNLSLTEGMGGGKVNKQVSGSNGSLAGGGGGGGRRGSKPEVMATATMTATDVEGRRASAGAASIGAASAAVSRRTLTGDWRSDAVWKLLVAVYFILPIHPHSQLSYAWNVITYINNALAGAGGAH